MTLAFPLSASSRAQLATNINQLVHQLLLSEWQLRQAHWNTRGAWFFARHELFERLGDSTREVADTLAERVGALGHPVEMNPVNVVSRAPSPLPSGLHPGETFLRGIAQHMVGIAADLRQCNDTATKLDDPVTADILSGAARELERNLWFLRSHMRPMQPLGAEPTRLPTPPPVPAEAQAKAGERQEPANSRAHAEAPKPSVFA